MKHWLLTLGCALGASGTAGAQEVEASEGSPAASPPSDQAAPVESRLSISVGTGLVSEYVSRGILFAEEVSLQPYATVVFALPELEGGPITDASVFVGTWNNIKLGSVPLGQAGGLTRFYETDIYAGASVELEERWTVAATYYRYESLAGSFEGYNDLELTVGFDDAGAWDGVPLKNFTLSPSLRLVQEAGRPGRKDALYVQPSITPSFDVSLGSKQVRIAMPLMIGLSDEYYDGVDGGKETFGFFRTGLTVSGQPAPEDVPALSLDGGFDLWVPNEEVVSGLEEYEIVGRVGISWGF